VGAARSLIETPTCGSNPLEFSELNGRVGDALRTLRELRSAGVTSKYYVEALSFD